MIAPKRILLVEDSPTQAARLARFLSAEGVEVIQVGNAELALKRLESERPDIIVLDNHLPGMTGNEFCREIRLNVNTRAIPVLMLTAENSDAAQMQGLASGADDYVVKSVDPDILRARIRALVRKSEVDTAVPDVESRFSRARILVIDDSETYLHYIREALKSEHYQVELTHDPEEGLRRIAAQQFDCVLVDFEMPKLNGADVCRRIRQTHSESEPEIVLIVYSSHEDKRRMTEGFEAGADDYISKSADFSVTKARIRALLRRKFLVEENRRISEEIRQKEMEALHARTEQRAAEVRAELADQLTAANRELDRANQELEQFAYAAAHDLQEPLRKVRLFSELVRKDYADKLDARAVTFLDYCVDGAGRMHQLIEDLLAYARTSKAAAGAVETENLATIVERVLESLRGAIDDSQAVILCGNLPTVAAEPIRLQQLFQNLIGNALKYRRHDVAPKVEISAEAGVDEWIISVRDNGVGMAPAYFGKIFEPFTRLDATDRTGTGLGLAICKRIVEHSGGRIWVESTPMVGSTFHFTIPAQMPSAAAESTAMSGG